MAQVLLINPPYVFNKDGVYLSEKGWKPLGLLYLAAVLKKEGISTEILDLMPAKISMAVILKSIEELDPKIVGITSSSSQIRGAVQLGNEIKKKFGKKVTLVLGGVHLCADPGFLKEFPFFDVGLIGEGEITFPKVAKKILEGKKFEGIIYGEPSLDLDKLPFPDRSLLDDNNYEGPYGSNYATIHTTRGCPFACLYCSSPVERLSKTRFRSPENVVDEIEMLFNQGYKFFIFTDDTFTVDRQRTEKICKEILKRRLDIRWNCETRANLVDEPLLSLMKKSGCVEIFFGVESGSERIRKEIIHKNISNDDFFKAFGICRKLGIITNAFLMAGLPTETKKELKETWDFCFKTEPDIVGIHLTTILPGSPLFDLSVKEGRIKKNIWNGYAKGKIKEQPIYVPDGLTRKDLLDFQRKLYHKFYFRPSWLLRRAKISFSSVDRFREDIRIGNQLLFKGRMKSRSFKEEDYIKK